eukprot:TRINITY_DN1073_c0_g1_i19.p1 TRINITY_DN1073_c0_g1~~TRINITY_DN1073_c0_g1_i19.p1  ORF type:complete len:332 (+),score=64.90 TRINITY_DN1073_c0_g1_i19:2-997(+)
MGIIEFLQISMLYTSNTIWHVKYLAYLILLFVCARAERGTLMITKAMLKQHFNQLEQTGQLHIDSPQNIPKKEAKEGKGEGEVEEVIEKSVSAEEKLTFWSGFVDSLSMIFFVEFGDRTFMIVVLFTMKHDKWKVFIPAIFTMMGMHVISVGFGTLFPLLFSRNTIVYFSVFLFLFFGIMMIYEAYHMQPKSAEEKVMELQTDLLSKEAELKELPEASQQSPDIIKSTGSNIATAGNSHVITIPANADTQLPVEEESKKGKERICKNPYLHLVVLLFLADWGDRCQISAIVLTATHNAWGVAVGGSLVTLCVKVGNGSVRLPRCAGRSFLG